MRGTHKRTYRIRSILHSEFVLHIILSTAYNSTVFQVQMHRFYKKQVYNISDNTFWASRFLRSTIICSTGTKPDFISGNHLYNLAPRRSQGIARRLPLRSRLGQVRLGYVKLGQVKLGQVSLGLISDLLPVELIIVGDIW